MNSRSCERVNGFAVILRGYVSMAGELAGDQWNEGDVSCSVVRRVALPDAFFAIDGLLETFLTVLDEFGAFPAVIERELRPLPAVPRHHQGAHGRGQATASAARPRTRPSRSTRSPSRWRCARRAPSATTCSTGSPPTRGSGSPREQLDGAGRRPDRVHRRRARPGEPRRRRDRAPRRREAGRRGLHPRADPLVAMLAEPSPSGALSVGSPSSAVAYDVISRARSRASRRRRATGSRGGGRSSPR